MNLVSCSFSKFNLLSFLFLLGKLPPPSPPASLRSSLLYTTVTVGRCHIFLHLPTNNRVRGPNWPTGSLEDSKLNGRRDELRVRTLTLKNDIWLLHPETCHGDGTCCRAQGRRRPLHFEKRDRGPMYPWRTAASSQDPHKHRTPFNVHAYELWVMTHYFNFLHLIS